MKCRWCKKTKVDWFQWLTKSKCFPCYVMAYQKMEEEIAYRMRNRKLQSKLKVVGKMKEKERAYQSTLEILGILDKYKLEYKQAKVVFEIILFDSPYADAKDVQSVQEKEQ